MPSPSILSFTLALAAAATAATSAKFTTELWEPQFKRRDEEKPCADPFPLQKLAALHIFNWMYCSSAPAVWVHLAAEMQAGKTGVINALFRLVLANSESLHIVPERIFMLTGMSDDDWQEQTAKRLPRDLRDNVHHSGTLSRVAAKLEALATSEPDGRLRNVLIALDESHHATSSRNRPAQYVYKVVERVCPRELWAKNGIRFLTVSATDPSKVLAMKGSDVPTAVVRLQTSEAYQSVESLKNTGRLRWVSKTLHEAAGADALCAEVRILEATHGPLVHILRPNMVRNKDANASVEALLKERMPGCVVVPWDMESKKAAKKAAKDNGTTVSDDINDTLLSAKPAQTTFILLKGMFRAAKTLDDTHIGVMYDRVGGSDSTNLQSLLGRSCGYDKSRRTVIFASKTTVDKYLKLWRDICRDHPMVVTDIPITALKSQMPGVAAKKNNGAVALAAAPALASPLGSGAAQGAPPRRPRGPPPDDSVFDVAWSAEFRTEAEARAAGGKQLTRDENGFYKNRMGGKGPMTREQLVRVQAGSKLAHSRIHKRPDQQVDHTSFAWYEDTLDVSTVRFIVRTLTRK